MAELRTAVLSQESFYRGAQGGEGDKRLTGSEYICKQPSITRVFGGGVVELVVAVVVSVVVAVVVALWCLGPENFFFFFKPYQHSAKYIVKSIYSLDFRESLVIKKVTTHTCTWVPIRGSHD